MLDKLLIYKHIGAGCTGRTVPANHSVHPFDMHCPVPGSMLVSALLQYTGVLDPGEKASQLAEMLVFAHCTQQLDAAQQRGTLATVLHRLLFA